MYSSTLKAIIERTNAFNTLATEILKWSFLKYGGRTTHGPIYQNFSLIE